MLLGWIPLMHLREKHQFPATKKPFASQACALPDERSEDGKLKRLQFTQLPCSVKFYILFKLLVVNCLPPLVRGTAAYIARQN